jgi:hypothetical protein
MKQNLKLLGVLEKHQVEVFEKSRDFMKEAEVALLRKEIETLAMLKERGKRLIEANDDIIEELERRKKHWQEMIFVHLQES